MSNEGNPNIKDYAHLGGAKTPMGKLKCSLNAIKYKHNAIQLGTKGASVISKALGDPDNKYKLAGESLKEYYEITEWIKSKTVKELDSIYKLEKLISILELDVSLRALDKVKDGIPLDDADRRQMTLLKDALVEHHKLKYGEKKINVNVSIKNLRGHLFDDNRRD